jgi:gluconolactonase
MFAPVKILDASSYTRLPENFRSTAPNALWVERQPASAARRSLLEGPSFDRNGNLYFVDVPQGSIYRASPQGQIERVARYEGLPSGLKIHKDGRIFVADYGRGIMLLDPAAGTVTPYLTETHLGSFKGVNDLFFARNGDLYFTDQGGTGLHDPTGRVFRLAADGTITCLLDNVPSPNGLVMNLDETVLYLAVTRGNCVWRVPLSPDGTVARVGIFIQLSGGIGPDGLALDAKGRIAIAHAGLSTVWVADEHGELVYRIKSSTGTQPSNLAFGGSDGKSLFITEAESATILRMDLDVPGKPMYSHQQG